MASSVSWKWSLEMISGRYSGAAVTKVLWIASVLCILFIFPVMKISAKQATAAPQKPVAAQPKQNSYPEFPQGEGRETALRICGRCHSPNNILAAGQDRQGWESTITKMTTFGATASDEEFSEILDYLVKNFPDTGKLNVNQATAAQLMNGLSLTANEAKEIVDYRTRNGLYKTLDDLKKVPNVDAKKLDAKKDNLIF
jgi:competence protein ComEA